ncbi:hypothetical protein M514_09081 [Trichuris suis]|uniref:Uncharacterized protein n=1 Tax=Trichuris suis TaxID=68888 RepID=A0A085LYE2_9BILA|nr:hypothetical protein M513_09081 [Trichuris suis]KFD64722.1 hypothetical protein M514_09081 [Trichuris suis]
MTTLPSCFLASFGSGQMARPRIKRQLCFSTDHTHTTKTAMSTRATLSAIAFKGVESSESRVTSLRLRFQQDEWVSIPPCFAVSTATLQMNAREQFCRFQLITF